MVNICSFLRSTGSCSKASNQQQLVEKKIQKKSKANLTVSEIYFSNISKRDGLPMDQFSYVMTNF